MRWEIDADALRRDAERLRADAARALGTPRVIIAPTDPNRTCSSSGSHESPKELSDALGMALHTRDRRDRRLCDRLAAHPQKRQRLKPQPCSYTTARTTRV